MVSAFIDSLSFLLLGQQVMFLVLFGGTLLGIGARTWGNGGYLGPILKD